MTLDLTLILLPVICIALYAIHKRYKQAINLPPGPKRLPLIGSLLSWPRTYMHVTLAEWGAKYGPVTYTELLGKPYLILNTAETVLDLHEKRATLYAGRQQRPMLDLTTISSSIVSSQYTLRTQRLRGLVTNALGNSSSLTKVTPAMEECAHRFIRRLVERKRPAVLKQETVRTTGEFILGFTYGYQVAERGDDPFIELMRKSLQLIQYVGAPKPWAVDIFPILRHVPEWAPGAGFKRFARKVRTLLQSYRAMPHEWVQKEMAAGRAKPSFVSVSQSACAPEDLSEETDLIRWASHGIFTAGFDTIASSMHAFFLMMLRNPEVQALAQAEISQAIGCHRLPTLADRDYLPYVSALVKEVLRVAPVFPIGIPHRLLEDDEYNGHFLPKNATVIVNVWSILRDPTVYQSPSPFNPARFMGPEPEPDPSRLVFGFGRRVCPGKMLAQASLFISIATCLALVDIQPAKDEAGRPIIPEEEYTPGLMSHPIDFPCTITPRSDAARAMAGAVELTAEA